MTERPIALRNLAIANRVRITRAADKRRIAAGELDAQGVLLQPPAHWEQAPVVDLLTAVPHVGVKKATTWTRQLRMLPTRKLVDLTMPERAELSKRIALVSAKTRLRERTSA